MLVKEIIKKASTLIGREDVYDYLNGVDSSPSEQVLKTVDIMVRLLNMVVSELAGSFVPMIITEPLYTSNGKIYYSQLSFSPKEILKAYDRSGVNCLTSVEHAFATVNSTRVDVEYACFPNEVGIDGELNYTEKDVTSTALAYGVLAEYAITQGCFKDAVMWHERYADSVNEHCKPKNAMVKRRDWS